MNITAGKYKGTKIIAPDSTITRPTLSKVRMSVFNTLQSIISFENSSFLDMYAGSGIMGAEAISRGFTRVVSIEKNKKVFQILKTNFSKLKNENIKLILGDSLKITETLQETFDIIYIDPPYFAGIYEKSLNSVQNIASNLIILEHVNEINLENFEIIKQKKYGDKYITFLQKIKSSGTE